MAVLGVIFSCLILSVTVTVTVAESGAELQKFEDFLRVARENNPGVQAAYSRWQSELNRAEVIGALPDPTLSYRYFIEPVQTRTGPQEHRIALSQKLPWFGKLNAQQQAQLARADGAYDEYRAVLLKMEYELLKIYAEAWLLNRETELTDQNITLLKDIERVAESRMRAGASAADVIKTQLERAQLEEQLLTLEERMRPVNTELNVFLNRLPESPVPVIHELEFRTNSLKSLPSVDGHPSVAALLHSKDSADAEALAVSKKGMPDLTFGIEWIGIGESDVPVSDSGKDAWVAGVSINLPLWRGSYRADAAQASYTSDMYDFARQQQVNLLNTKLEEAIAGFREAERKITLYNDTILPQAEQLLDLNATDYRSGKATFLDLIDTQRMILNYRLELARARAAQRTQLARIEMLIGKEL